MNKNNHFPDKPDDLGRRDFLKGALAFSTVALVAQLAVPAKVFALPETDPGKALYAPKGVAFSGDDGCFVADAGNYCVRRFDSVGNLIGSIGNPGSGPGELNFPTDVALKQNTLFVLDTNNGRVCIFEADTGRYLRAMGGLGGASDRLFTPQGMTITDDFLFVANTRSHCVTRWNLQSDRAEMVIGILGDESSPPLKGDRDLRFRLPGGVAADKSAGIICIADTKHNRVVVTDWYGGFLFSYTGQETGQKLLRPSALSLSGETVYIADTGNGRVLALDLQAKSGKVIPGQWTVPVGLAVKENQLAVSDEKSRSLLLTRVGE